jgi:type VI secretion system protein VasD
VAFAADSFRKDGIWFSSDGGRILVDQNRILTERGVDVLNVPRTQGPVVKTSDQHAQTLENPLDSATDVFNE